MNISEEVVKSSDGGEWQVNICLPETVDEALDIYGQDGVLTLFNAGLKVKLQNIARNKFRAGDSREAVESAMSDYRPGQTSRKSKKMLASELVVENGVRIAEDSELKEQIMKAFVSQDWQAVIDILG